MLKDSSISNIPVLSELDWESDFRCSIEICIDLEINSTEGFWILVTCESTAVEKI